MEKPLFLIVGSNRANIVLRVVTKCYANFSTTVQKLNLINKTHTVNILNTATICKKQ